MHQNVAFLGINGQTIPLWGGEHPLPTPFDAFGVSASMPKAFGLGLLLYKFVDTPLPQYTIKFS